MSLKYDIMLQDPNHGVDCMVRAVFPTLKKSAAPANSKPTSRKQQQKGEQGSAEPQRLPFLMHGGATASGYAYFMKMPSLFFSWLRHLPGVIFDADPETTPIPPPSDITPQRFPVLVYCHGLGGTPDCYSTIVADFVARGWVVFTPEHAEGSAAFTQFPDGTKYIYSRLTAEEMKDQHKEYKLRHRQLKQRADEARAVLDLVCKLAGYPVPDADDIDNNNSNNNSNNNNKRSEPDDIALLQYFLEGRVDHTRMVVGGHSFGAATAIAAAERDRRVCGVIAHDPWMFPLSPATLTRGLAHVPILSVCGDTFTAWRQNANALKLLLSADHRARHPAAETPGDDVVIPRNGVMKDGTVHKSLVIAGDIHPNNVLLTIPGSEHQNFNDFAVLMRRVLRWTKLIGPMDPHRFFIILNEITAAFATEAISHVGQARSKPASTFHFALPASVKLGEDVTVGPWTAEQIEEAEAPR